MSIAKKNQIEIHLLRFLDYYKRVSAKDFPSPGEIIYIKDDIVKSLPYPYWSFYNSLRTLKNNGYLIKIRYQRGYIVTEKLVEDIKQQEFLLDKEKDILVRARDLVIELFYLITLYKNLKLYLMMELGAKNSKELATTIKSVIDVIKDIDERLNLLNRRLDKFENDLKVIKERITMLIKLKKDEMPNLQESSETGRVVTE